MIKAKSIKVELPKKWLASNAVLEEVDKNLITKKLKKYGFFDENGKWKEK
jgi:hypothetical protein